MDHHISVHNVKNNCVDASAVKKSKSRKKYTLNDGKQSSMYEWNILYIISLTQLILYYVLESIQFDMPITWHFRLNFLGMI